MECDSARGRREVIDIQQPCKVGRALSLQQCTASTPLRGMRPALTILAAKLPPGAIPVHYVVLSSPYKNKANFTIPQNDKMLTELHGISLTSLTNILLSSALTSQGLSLKATVPWLRNAWQSQLSGSPCRIARFDQLSS